MSKLLHIESSPRKERSHSISAAKEFIKGYKAANPNDEVETWDLWAEPLPEFDGKVLNAKYKILHGQDHTDEEAEAWNQIVAVFERFNSADKYLISLPMWNFGIPYKLKHLIDVITQPGLAFSFSPESGYTGLVTGKPVAVAYARGGAYGSEETKGMDFQKTYMELLLGFIGFTEVNSIIVEPTLAAPEQIESAIVAARDEAKQISAAF